MLFSLLCDFVFLIFFLFLIFCHHVTFYNEHCLKYVTHVAQGTAVVQQKRSEEEEPIEVGKLAASDYFGG